MAKRVRQGDPKVAIGYVRVSTDEQRLGPKAQAEALAAWAAREGISLLAIFIDRGVSGATPLSERRALIDALASLSVCGAGVLVAAKRDRLARDPSITRTIEAESARAGATVRTADGTSDATGSAGVLSRGLHDLLGEWEREVIRERTKAALAVKKARGERVGGIPYGWSVAADRTNLEPHAGEQAVLTLVRELTAQGLSARKVSAELERRGVRSRVGKPFMQTQILRMLQIAVLAVAA